MKKFFSAIFTLCFFAVSVFGQSKFEQAQKYEEEKNYVYALSLYYELGEDGNHFAQEGFDDFEMDNSVSIEKSSTLSFDLNKVSFNKNNKKISKSKSIKILSFSVEFPTIIEEYKKAHPDFDWEIEANVISSVYGDYNRVLEDSLINETEDSPDIFLSEMDFLYQFTKGYMQKYSMPIKDLGIDIDKAIKDAEIAKYLVELGSNSNGQVIGLSYESDAGVFIYRRSIAKQIFGTDDPEIVAQLIGAGSGSWDKFLEVGKLMTDSGIALISSIDNLWHVIDKSAEKGWVENFKLYIDPKREEFMDIAKQLTDYNMTNNTMEWHDAWYADIKGEGPRPCFGFFGPAWFLNFTLSPNCGDTYGDWAICPSPVGFYRGGYLIHVNAKLDEYKKAAVKDIIEWITLDSSENGFQYKYASGQSTISEKYDSVPSSAVMKKLDGRIELLNNQNMFDSYIQANQQGNGNNLFQYDTNIDMIWNNQVEAYTNGTKSKEEALRDFKLEVYDEFGFEFEI